MEHLLTREFSRPLDAVCSGSVAHLSNVARKSEVGLANIRMIARGMTPNTLFLDYRRGTRVLGPEESLYYTML